MIAGLLLAAGGSSRFGSQKLLATLHDVAVVRHSASMLAGVVDCAFAVVGADADAVERALDGLGLVIVRNQRWGDGLSGSLRAGVALLPADADAVLVALGDQPLVARETFEAVVTRWRAGGASIVAPVFRGERGHPVLFAREVFTELARLRGDVGAREVIRRDPARVALVEIADSLPVDVDTPDDLRRLTKS